jgi:crotonobetainyl-CoA:carnitine CoA-transferase CaiB-like acyl-CoA transferase
MQLADLGAEVIKVESRISGDEIRQWGPPFVESPTGHRDSSYFMSLNRSKKSISVDLKSLKGQKIVHDLASQSDVFI